MKTEPKLSEVDVEMLKLIVNGATNQDIARELGVSTATTGRRLTALFEKLGATDRTHAAVLALISKLVAVKDVDVPTWVVVELTATREALRVVVEPPRVLDV